MKQKIFYYFLDLLLFVFFGSCTHKENVDPLPNVLLIICDDLNDSVEGMGGHPQAITPNIDKLASQGVQFFNAHCSAPLCGPSRASLWTGIYPHKSGIIGYNQNNYTWRDSPVLKDVVTVFEHFAANGYQVYTTGKIFHNNQHLVKMIHDLGGADAVGAKHSFGPWPWDGAAKSQSSIWNHPSMKEPWGRGGFETVAPLSDVPNVLPDLEKGIPGYHGWRELGKPFKYNGPNDRDLMTDEKSAQWAIEQLTKKQDKPFLLTVGIFRPHCPWIAPDEFFNLFDQDSIQLPPYLPNDTEDCSPLSPGRFKKNDWTTRLQRLQAAYPENEGWKMWVRGYLACVAFADHQIGKVLDSLEASEYADNTIVILTSDHGFHMGEKDLLLKNTVWEESTRVPFIIRVPGNDKNAGQVCKHPVSLIDLYPTLIDLCGLPKSPNIDGNRQSLDGYSLRPFLENLQANSWDGPEVALTAVTGLSKVEIGDIPPVNEQHYSVRSYDFRYCRWSDGFEELYDHRNDPHEWHNLAKNPDYLEIKEKLRKQMDELIQN